ncbi:MAG: response regulator receiver protein [Pedosphaera sp.]|nr:response regulator receiver protein [Pedosphaera sp.]
MAEKFEIVVVDDYQSDVQLVLRMFKRNRIANKIHVVHDGVEALDFVFCRGAYSNRSLINPPGVILLDIRLPKLDGWETLRQIKSDPRTRNIPVLMISGLSSADEQEKARQMGALGCIEKPIRFEQLREALVASGFVWSIVVHPES